MPRPQASYRVEKRDKPTEVNPARERRKEAQGNGTKRRGEDAADHHSEVFVTSFFFGDQGACVDYVCAFVYTEVVHQDQLETFAIS